MIKTAIRCPDNMVMLFDEDGEQIPLYQGQYESVKESILQNAPLNAIFGHLRDFEPELLKFPRELRLFALLIEKVGHIITHKELPEKVWGSEYTDDLDYVRIYISHLRQKIESDPALPRYIMTEPRVGYHFQKGD